MGADHVAIPVRVLSLCSGIGLLDLAVSCVLATRTLAYCERDAYCAAVLIQRMADSALDPGPIWSDLATFPYKSFIGAVDLVLAGFPCQDISPAGSRVGLQGGRSGLFHDVLHLATRVGARWLFLENSGNASRLRGGAPLRGVLEAFAALGWDAEWCHLSASDCGAAHERDRWWCLAHRPVADPGPMRHDPHSEVGERRGGAPAGAGGEGLFLEHSDVTRSAPEAGTGGPGPALAQGRAASSSGNDGLEYSNSFRREARNRSQSIGTAFRDALDTSHWGIGFDDLPSGFAPCADDERWAGVLERCPALAPAAQPPLRGVADGSLSRLERVGAIGNAVVPLVASVAFRELARRYQ